MAANVPLMSLALVCSSRCSPLGVVEPVDGPAREAHGSYDFGVAGIGIRDGVADDGRLARRAMQPLGHDLADDRKDCQHESAGKGQRAQQGMKEVDERQIDRHPWQIEQCGRPLAAQEPADSVDVPSAFQRLRRREAETRHVDGDAMGQRRDLLIEPRADADENLRADDVEAALEHVEADGKGRQDEKRRDASAGQGSIVDLHHVQRAGQREQVDEARYQEEKQHNRAKTSRQFREVPSFCRG
jgi:hypothetical protein